MTGTVEAIHIAASKGRPVEPRERIRAIAGKGLDGDRYAAERGEWSGRGGRGRHLTLIEGEAIEAAFAEFGVRLEPGESRRNVTTRGIRLNELVGRRFYVGDVLCEATGLCEPCQYLQRSLGKPVLRPLVHRGGLRADILTDGEIHVGDPIRVADEVDPGSDIGDAI